MLTTKTPSALIVVASKHGGTQGIAEVIADELQSQAVAVDLRDVDDDPMVQEYDLVIIGSAVYMGSWLPDAWRFVERHHTKLANMPVWLFSSGPLGEDDPQPTGDPAHLDDLMAKTGARGHQIFAGKLDISRLGMGERFVVKLVKAPAGDFRDWEAIRGWAREVAAIALTSALSKT